MVEGLGIVVFNCPLPFTTTRCSIATSDFNLGRMSKTKEVAAGAGGSGQTGTSNSATVSSSSKLHGVKPPCDNCEAPPSPAVVFCHRCKYQLCELCDRIVHTAVKANRNHEPRMKIDNYLKIQRSLGSSSPTDDQLVADAENMLWYFCPLDNRVYVVLHRLNALVPDQNAHPSLVAFIGPTGVGKSTLQRLLLTVGDVTDADGDMPVVGGRTDPQSTSGDIHIYAGGQVAPESAADSPYPLLYVDSEGFGGSIAPRATKLHWTTLENYLSGRIMEYGKYLKERSKHVKESYPRMLYIFSDVVCFVFSGNLREHASIVKPLIRWGKSASMGAANQFRPRLILIFNKNDPEFADHKFDDVRWAFEEWMSGDESNEKYNKKLRFYYVDPILVHIPHMDSDTPSVWRRAKILLQEIRASTMKARKSREKVNQLYTLRQLQKYMQLAADTFSKNPKANFDIFTASMALRSPSVGLAGYIGDFRLAVEANVNRESESKTERYKKSLDVLQMLIKSSVLLWTCRLSENPPVGQLHQDLKTALEEAQTVIDGEMPCAAGLIVGQFVWRCDRVRKMHEKGVPHACENISGWRWAGEFVPDRDTQRAANECRLVELAKDALQETNKLDLDETRRQLSEVRRSMHEKYPSTKELTSFLVCVSCMFELPTEMLSCGHYICAKCAKEVTDMPSPNLKIVDLTCPTCLTDHVKWYRRELPPLAGYRILSLDGGGVRGIVELVSLQEVMSFFPGMHVEDLFDIIAGTSTGGIIALALTVHALNMQPNRLSAVITLFNKLSKAVFSKKMLTFFGAGFPLLLRIFQFAGLYNTKYKPDNLLKYLGDHFGCQSLLCSCVGGPHVIITSCDGSNKYSAAWFTSYNRRELGTEQTSTELSGRVADNHLFSPKDAAAASSAAGTFFPAYNAGGRFWVDGGLRFNCPAAIAIEEANSLWPGRQASVVISLGSGALNYTPKEEHSDNLIFAIKQVGNIVTDAEAKFEEAKKLLQNESRGRALRLNPTIEVPRGKKCELDKCGDDAILGGGDQEVPER